MQIEEHGGEESRSLIAGLSKAVYPPEVLASIAWRNVKSAGATRRVLVKDGEEVVASAGVTWRSALLDGAHVLIGGLGGVMTWPARQGTGLGRLAVLRATELLTRDQTPSFGLLFCERKNTPFYGKLGWTTFAGTIIVEQPAGRIVYDIMQPMVIGLHAVAPTDGDLDLCGLPW